MMSLRHHCGCRHRWDGRACRDGVVGIVVVVVVEGWDCLVMYS